MFDKKISTREILKNLLKALLAITAAIAIIFFICQEITKKVNALAEKSGAAVLLQQRSESIALLRSQLAQIGENVTKLELTLPSDDNISSFLSIINGLAKQDGLTQTIQVGTP